MGREAQPIPTPQLTRSRVAPQVAKVGDAAIVTVSGLIDERFPGFGDLSEMKTVVLDLGGITFMSSFGVRQWLRSMAAIPSSVQHLYMVSCPSIIVDQLNMILNFGGAAKVVSLAAPFVCAQCGVESKETVDVVAQHDNLLRGDIVANPCKRCGGRLEFDEMADSYFACLKKYGATSVEPIAAQLIATSATLRKSDVERSVPPATTNPGEGTPAGVAAAESAGRGRPYLLAVAVGVVSLLVAAGVYVLAGPS